MDNKTNINDYGKEYSEPSLWEKVGKYALTAGKITIEKVLVLYFCLQDADTPKWAKGTIIAALGYFIIPLDLIPDLTPGVGYADDLGALAAASAAVMMYIKPEHEKQAKKKLKEWFGKNA